MTDQKIQASEFARTICLAVLRRSMGQSDTCAPPRGAPPVVTFVHAGWSFAMFGYDHPKSSHIQTAGRVSHYHLSAKLYPPGRGSTEEDWQTLGIISGAIMLETGYSADAPPEPIVPIPEVDPTQAVHWMWHNDSSKVDADVLTGVANALKLVQTREVQARIAAESRRVAETARVEKTGRNDECPCGSGKKFKRCHGAS